MNKSNINQIFIDLLAEAPSEFFEAGQYLIKQGEHAGFAFLIRHGNVLILRQTKIGDPVSVKEIAARNKNDLIGELSLFNNVRSASALASTPVECARISHGTLLQQVSTNSAIALSLLALVMQKAQDV
jgi:CRP-like cAMP-binding protein